MVAKRKLQLDPQVGAPVPRVRPQLAQSGSSAVPSPAVALQDQLSVAFAIEERWSARRTLAFLLITCGASWALMIAAVSRFL